MNYKKLFEDKQKGLIDERMVLVFDNDGGYWRADIEDEIEHEAMCEKYSEEYGEPDGYHDLVDIRQGAGFKSEWC